MTEVAPKVWVGNQEDATYGWKQKDEWAFIYCAKSPWHKEFVGYTGNGCPKDSPEYFYAIRDNAIALNMVDVDNPRFFHVGMIQAALAFAFYYKDSRLLFSCNQGLSRGPSIAMLYLATICEIPQDSFHRAERYFKRIYPYYNPGRGIREHLMFHWDKYLNIGGER